MALFSLLLLAIILPPAFGKDFTASRKSDGYGLDVAINRNPPIMGKNEIRFEIKDPSGKNVSNAIATVNYFMPAMPGMPPMNYTVKAMPSGSGYAATMDLIMRGPWIIVIKASAGGKQLRISVPIDVR